jgi:hypothetical protein
MTPSSKPKQKKKTVNSLFDSKEEALEFKRANNIHVREPELLYPAPHPEKWALIYPLECHVTVVLGAHCA